MYKIVDETGNIYTQHTYTKELDFERMIVANQLTTGNKEHFAMGID